MLSVRSSLAGLLFGVAAMMGSLAVSGLWLQSTALSPAPSQGDARAVLVDNDLRTEIAKVIADATAPTLGQNPAAVQKVVAAGITTGEGSDLLAGVVADAHARLIGSSTKPVLITAEQMVPLVGYELAATVAPVTVDVPKVGALSITRQVLRWLVPLAAVAAILLIIIGFAAHPERSELMRSLSYLLLGTALLLVIIGQLMPSLILPLFSKTVWMAILPRLAGESVRGLVIAVIALVIAGIGSLVASGATRRRDRWSQPIRTRYNEQRRWG
jgi:hypothetical protein